MKLSKSEVERIQFLKDTKPAAAAKCAEYDNRLAAGHSIALIQYQYNYQCNFNCPFCSIADFRRQAHKRQLDVAKTKDIFDQAHDYGLAHMGISGGEPLTFPDFDDLVNSIGPDRFHIQLDTNGWLMTPMNAWRARDLGIDKVQVSIEAANATDHDRSVGRPGSFKRCMAAMDNVRDAGLQLQVSTVVWHDRVASGEFKEFMRLMFAHDAPVSVIYAKPCGDFLNSMETLCTPDDIREVKRLMDLYGGYTHTTPGYGRDMGCLAVKRSVSITAFGEVLPCPWMYFTLGNVYDTPLADILDKGMKYFGERSPVCRMSEDKRFIELYADKANSSLPAIEKVMGELK
jgi:MoaA/NifB/PqqE/SkfB family radical SAM enzyme